MKNTSFTVTKQIPVDRVQDLLCCALEGGSNYWYRIEKFIEPTEFLNYCDSRSNHDEKPDFKPEVFRHIDYPTNPGGSIIVSDYHGVEGDVKSMTKTKLNIKSISKGLKIMAEKYPRHYGNFTSDNEDAETGDVFLQCCVLGTLVYG